MKWKVGVAFLAGFVSSAASAHWQYTKWGMRPDEVVAASEGKAHLSGGTPEQKEEGLEVRGEGEHMIGSTKLPATFYFGGDGLQLVKLRGEGDALCWAMDQRLQGEYGKPFAAQAGPILTRKTWKDEERGNRLEYLRIGDGCWLKYRPLSFTPNSEL